MNAFHGPGGRRAIGDELRAYVERTIGATPVDGFAEIAEMGDAIPGGERISGFTERHVMPEYLLRVDAGEGMSFRSHPVPANCLDKVAIYFSLGFGNGSPLPQPSGRWDISVNGRHAVSVRVVNHSQLWDCDEARLAFAANRVESAEPFGSLQLSSIIRDEAFATFGPAVLEVPASWVRAGHAVDVTIEPRGEYASTRWLQIHTSPGMLDQSDIYRALDLLTGARVPTSGGHNVYFGDIHTHSGQVIDECEDKGCGMGTWESNYEYALGPGGMDFYALTDHEWQVDPARIGEYLGLADQHEQPGRFVCLPAFEFTNLLYGHRNVYFRRSGGTVVNANREWGRPTRDPALCLHPRELWDALENHGTPFITVPHHPSSTSHPCTWEFFDDRYDRLIEVYSVWGSSEYYGDFPRGVSDRYQDIDVRDAIRKGLRFGLIASADGHDGHPGNAQSPMCKHHHQFHFCGSGRAAVLAPELTREAVFDALYDRRCYATTGVPIVLDVSLNGALMGSQIPVPEDGRAPVVSVRCIGASSLDHIRVVKNARVVATVPCHGELSCEFEWEDASFDPSQANSYYIRAVQRDRESAWSSPIWVG